MRQLTLMSFLLLLSCCTAAPTFFDSLKEGEGLVMPLRLEQEGDGAGPSTAAIARSITHRQ